MQPGVAPVLVSIRMSKLKGTPGEKPYTIGNLPPGAKTSQKLDEQKAVQFSSWKKAGTSPLPAISKRSTSCEPVEILRVSMKLAVASALAVIPGAGKPSVHIDLAATDTPNSPMPAIALAEASANPPTPFQRHVAPTLTPGVLVAGACRQRGPERSDVLTSAKLVTPDALASEPQKSKAHPVFSAALTRRRIGRVKILLQLSPIGSLFIYGPPPQLFYARQQVPQRVRVFLSCSGRETTHSESFPERVCKLSGVSSLWGAQEKRISQPTVDF